MDQPGKLGSGVPTSRVGGSRNSIHEELSIWFFPKNLWHYFVLPVQSNCWRIHQLLPSCASWHAMHKNIKVFSLLSQALQLGPTELSRYWIYWVPSQYVDAIKDAILGKWQYFWQDWTRSALLHNLIILYISTFNLYVVLYAYKSCLHVLLIVLKTCNYCLVCKIHARHVTPTLAGNGLQFHTR